MSEITPEADQSHALNSTPRRFSFGIRHLFVLTTVACLLLVSRPFGALPYLLELLLLGGMMSWMIRTLLRALDIGRPQLFRTGLWMTGLSIVYGVGMSILLQPHFYSSMNHSSRETVNRLIWIFILSFAVQLIILAEFFMYLYLKRTNPKRSLLMATVNLSPVFILLLSVLLRRYMMMLVE